ncbi:G-protein coupled receptor [Biomphalaria glabrata]|nr:putative G-protein coupled receptor [Biomphalaria glabrata]
MENRSDYVTEEMSLQNRTLSSENTTLSSEGYYVCWFRASSYEEYITFLGIFCFVNPLISFVGFVSNMISLAVLGRSGLHKSSNILLFGLVIADSLLLCTTLNYGVILFYLGPNKPLPRLCGFQYENNLNLFLALSHILMDFLGFWGQYVNSWIPVLITLERLIATFRPMTFKSIVTKRRTITLVLFCFLFWLPWNLYFSQQLKIVVRLYQGTKYVLVGYVNYDELMVKNFIEEFVIENLKSIIPVICVSVGCLCLSIKITSTLRNRSKLTSSHNLRTSSMRTTRTLTLTCVIFVVTQVIHIAGEHVTSSPYEMHYLVRNQFMYLFNNINASSNLFVYITSNKKLYNIFLKLFRRKHIRNR